MNYRHELQNTGNNSCVSCLGWRWHGGKKTVFMPRCSSAQRSVASALGEKCKQVLSGVRGVCDDVTCLFLHSGVVQVLKAGEVHTNYPLSCPDSPLQSSYVWFAGWPKPDSYRGAQNRLNNSWVKLSYAPVAGWTFSVDEGSTTSAEPFSRWSQCECPTSGPGRWWFPGSWMTPLQPQCCPWWWVGGERGVSPEVHYHLYSFERVQLQVVVTAPDRQLLNLLSVSRWL